MTSLRVQKEVNYKRENDWSAGLQMSVNYARELMAAVVSAEFAV